MPLEFMTLSLLKKIVSEHPVTYRYFISDELKKTIDASIPKCLKNAKVEVSLATKLYWLFNDIKSFAAYIKALNDVNLGFVKEKIMEV